MTDSPWAGGETTVTIKYGKGYEESWAVFRGTPATIRSQLLDFFEPEPETVLDLTLHELVLNMTALAHKSSLAQSSLGGQVISQPTRGGNNWAKAAAGQGAAPAEPERNPLFAKIEEVSSVEALKDLYARNADALKADAELLAAWKAKGKSLTEAAA